MKDCVSQVAVKSKPWILGGKFTPETGEREFNPTRKSFPVSPQRLKHRNETVSFTALTDLSGRLRAGVKTIANGPLFVSR